MDGTVRSVPRNEQGSSGDAAGGYNGLMRIAGAIPGAVLVAVLALGVGACGGGGSPTTTASSTRGAQAQTKPPPAERSQGRKGSHGANQPPREQSTRAAVRSGVAQTKPARLDAMQRQVAAVVRRYVDALDARRGKAVCSLFVPGALDEVRLPRERGDCGASLTASIGYRDPRGFPVYAGSRVARIASVSIAGSTARTVATTVTRFAGNREPSIEDDVVYLERHGGRWLIAKPSATFYRAIGTGDIPPSVLAPPH
jgi:hypothetical protein